MNSSNDTLAGLDAEPGFYADPWDFSETMLSKVSRTFALNIRVLPMQLRRQVLLAYLFCRIADTIEDDPQLNSQAKIHVLNLFADIFANQQATDAALTLFLNALPSAWMDSDDYEHILCRQIQIPIRLFEELPKSVQTPIGACVIEMCQGMKEFALAQNTDSGWFNPTTRDELDRYCYYVAGVVGNMLCDLFREYSPFIDEKLYQRMRQYSVSFGLGLQLTNIVKDVVDDVKRNISWLPLDLAKESGAETVQELYESENLEKGAYVVRSLSLKALKHLGDALQYALLIPAREPRIRLFCLWPLFLATESLLTVGNGKASFGIGRKPKITRWTVRKVLLWTTASVCFPRVLWYNYKQIAKRIRIATATDVTLQKPLPTP